MTIQEIKKAVTAGFKVCTGVDGYHIIKDKKEQYFIQFLDKEHLIGAFRKDGTPNFEVEAAYIEGRFPSTNEVREYMELHNADEAGVDNQLTMEDAEFYLRLTDKYYPYTDQSEKAVKESNDEQGMEETMKVNEDGFTWLVVRNNAREVFNTGQFELYLLHDDDTETLLESEDEVYDAVQNGYTIGIEVGKPKSKSEELIRSIDWKALRKQKLILAYMIMGWGEADDPDQKKQAEEAEGILNLIDAIQDHAADYLEIKDVFKLEKLEK